MAMAVFYLWYLRLLFSPLCKILYDFFLSLKSNEFIDVKFP